MFDDTITHQYPHPGGIHLRDNTLNRDLRAAKGILTVVIGSIAFMVWAYVIVRAFL